ncbi:MAG: hypothetical protein EpisKO_04410 [Epibacterium sp.]
MASLAPVRAVSMAANTAAGKPQAKTSRLMMKSRSEVPQMMKLHFRVEFRPWARAALAGGFLGLSLLFCVVTLFGAMFVCRLVEVQSNG